jgi:hypothetical protein
LIIDVSEGSCDGDTRSDIFESENWNIKFWLTVA